MTNATTAKTVTFTITAAHQVVYAARLAGVTLIDKTAEVGHYSRLAYEATLEGWDKIHTILCSARAVVSGTEKAVLTAAISRIPSAAARAEQEARFAARRAARAARRAARNA
jgi:hypothetical protein